MADIMDRRELTGGGATIRLEMDLPAAPGACVGQICVETGRGVDRYEAWGCAEVLPKRAVWPLPTLIVGWDSSLAMFPDFDLFCPLHGNTQRWLKMIIEMF